MCADLHQYRPVDANKGGGHIRSVFTLENEPLGSHPVEFREDRLHAPILPRPTQARNSGRAEQWIARCGWGLVAGEMRL